ncbi:MAG: HAD-IA family hydrolase [Duodenibacillus sp.]|nr:HAD-IA family hydrolase [Duodenibacillus sp.]
MPDIERPWELYVFDWDGTVMDTTGLIARGIQQAALAVGCPAPSLEVARSTIGLGFADTMAIACPSCPPERWDAFSLAYREWYIRREAEVDVFPGLRELLEKMRAAGLRLAVATGKSRRGLTRVFARTGVAPLFEATATADESFSKPNPAMLRRLEDETGVECRRMVMVGDSVHDMMLARNAGCAGVAVTWGGTPAAELARHGPAAIVSGVGELARALGVADLL